jgi:Stage II sporulation protein E (SpoIIE)
MHPHARSGVAAVVLAVAALFCASHGHSQTFDLENDRVQMAELHGMWRFHTGDDPDGKLGWADPGFDDSSWKLLRSDQPWSEQGYHGYRGMAWYRFQVILPAKHTDLALYIPGIDTSYQVFAGGRWIGQFGGLPPHEKVLNFIHTGTQQVIPIPADLASQAGPLSIAIRVWHWPRGAPGLGGGPSEAVRIGDANLLKAWMELQFKGAFWSVAAPNILLLGYLLAGFAGLGLFLLRPGEREYLWFSAAEFTGAAYSAWSVYPWFHPTWFHEYFALEIPLILAQGICFLTFLVVLLKGRKGSFYWIAIVSVLCSALVCIPGLLSWITIPVWFVLSTLIYIPYWVCVLLLLFAVARRGNVDARLMLGPAGLSYGALIVERALLGADLAGSQFGASYWLKFNQLFTWPFVVSVQNIADFLMQISILAILVLRFARTRSDEERHATELEAARVVQQVLVPEEIPQIPGFQIRSVYKPAGQVGGDFFQIIALGEGGLLAAIGDVSGKGMPAAMTVSLLVGTLRTLAHYTQSPGEILAAMNQGMLARADGGFTTCLVLRVDPEGTVTAANAGHLAPYCNGTELEIESGLPLGLSAQSSYPETTFTLKASEQLTLVTDGVVEARGKGGELFGFARTQAISREDAEQIAQTAQEFGQDDDITVLTLCHAGVPASV